MYDYVGCVNCGYEGTVEYGSNICCSCGEEGCLTWVEGMPQEVDEKMSNNKGYFEKLNLK